MKGCVKLAGGPGTGGMLNLAVLCSVSVNTGKTGIHFFPEDHPKFRSGSHSSTDRQVSDKIIEVLSEINARSSS